MIKPFLYRFAQKCLSPNRAQADPDYKYDEAVDMVRWLGDPDLPLAINVEGPKPPKTKKNDVEKGEDTKDQMMWS